MFSALLAAVVFATWPLAQYAGSRAPSNLGDPLLNAFLFGWDGHAIVGNPLHIFDAPMYNPEHLTLAFLENMLGLALPLAPLLWVTDNALLVVNVGLLLYPALAGLGAYLLVREVAGRRDVAVVVALAYAVTPVRLSQVGHVHVYATWTVPFVLLLLFRLARRPGDARATRRRVAALALTFAAGVWGSLTGAIFMALVVGAWLVWLLVRPPVPWRAIGHAAVGLGIGVVLSLPVVVPYLMARADYPDYRHPEEAALSFSASPGSYLSPPPGGAVVDDVYAELTQRFGREQGYWEKQLFPGLWLSAAGVAALALVAVRRRRGRDLSVPLLGGLVVVVGFVFSLGPRVGGDEDGFPLPFMVFESLIGLTRVPGRMGAVVPLGLALVAGWALAQASPWWRRRLLAVSLAAIVLEMAPSSIDMVRTPKPTAAHRAIADRGGVVLGLPTTELRESDGAIIPETVPRDTQHLYLSTKHFRPMVNGYASYAPASYWDVVRTVQDFPSPAGFALLQRRDIRTVVVQTDLLPGTRWRDLVPRLESWPGVRLIGTGDGVRVYDVTVAAGTDPA